MFVKAWHLLRQTATEFWSDNAIKSRWFSVPNPNLTIAFNPTGNWTFPTGTVWIKHFNLELTNGIPSSAKRLETRLLVKNASGLYGVTYRWGDSLTNATLVPEEGMDESFTIDDGGGILLVAIRPRPKAQIKTRGAYAVSRFANRSAQISSPRRAEKKCASGSKSRSTSRVPPPPQIAASSEIESVFKTAARP